MEVPYSADINKLNKTTKLKCWDFTTPDLAFEFDKFDSIMPPYYFFDNLFMTGCLYFSNI